MQPRSQHCRLCLKEDVDLRRSHILSEFLYEEVYDEQHRTVGVDPRPEKKDRVLQKGIREQLLCGECEGRLSKWEVYAAGVMRHLPSTANCKPGDLVWQRGLDYAKFKLFQMSLLWRSSIAEGATFAEVDLGPHTEKLRQMLFAENPGKPWEYGCIIAALRESESWKGIVKFPGKLRLEGHNAYHLVVKGLVWFFIVSNHAEKLSGQRSFLSERGDLPIHVPTKTAEEFFRGVARELEKAGKIL